MSAKDESGRPTERERAMRRSLRLQGTPVTEPMPLVDLLRRTPYRNAQIASEAAEQARVREALDLAVRVGELMLRSGAGAPQVEGSVAAICAAAGLTSVEIDITLQSLLIHVQVDDAHSETTLRVVRSTRHDYARLVDVHELVDDFVGGDIDLPQAAERLRQIKRSARIWPIWAVTLASGLLAAAVAIMLGAAPFTALLTIGVVLVVAAVMRAAKPLHLPEFYLNAAAALVATLLAWLAYLAGASGWIPFAGNDFAFMIAGGIVALLPGRTMASAVEDVISGYAVTGAGRLLAVGVSLTGLIIGVAMGLAVTLQLTTATELSVVPPTVLDLRPTQSQWWAALVGSFVVGATGAVMMQSRKGLIAPTAVLSMMATALFAVLTRTGEVGMVTATGLAAVGIGVVGRLVALRLGAPAMVVVVPATFALLPGLTIFRGLYEMVGQDDNLGSMTLVAGTTTLFTAGGVLLAIATGTTLGEIIASPWDRRMARVRRRLRT